MRILVAGGAGFVGSHLCEQLLGQGHDVICVDNLVSGRTTNIEHLRTSEGFQFAEANIIDELPSLPKLDRVYHLASPASPPTYKAHPLETLRVNSEGTWRLLELSRANQARFLYISSSEVYGDPLEHPQKEEHRGNVSSIGPRSMYDEGKRYGEALTLAHAGQHGTDVRVVRLFNTYGPRSDPNDGRMIPNFITQALLGKPITVYGTGNQTRSVCYVSDTVAGLIGIMETEEASGQVFNLGNPIERTVLEYAQAIAQAVGSGARFVYTEPAVGDDPQRRRPDISRVRRVVGWEPKISLEQGIEATVAYFREELNRQGLVVEEPSHRLAAALQASEPSTRGAI
jgi:UDP-glucuronate decarboxylase